ncbi:MAG: signal peptidase II [Burkholderiaceae bacterium]|jgi:signal peptidase II|nr:signal peptidase II [Burkholderiaceae bacterium]
MNRDPHLSAPQNAPAPSAPKTRSVRLWLTLAMLVVVADQFTKQYILNHYGWAEGSTVTHFFNIVRVHNLGAAFSFLAGASGWQRWLFTLIGVAAALFIMVLMRSHAHRRLFALSLALILGGALGNVLDRLMHGYVIDFLDFHWSFLSPLFPGGHFPAFNLADSAITAGAIGLILDELLRWRRRGE